MPVINGIGCSEFTFEKQEIFDGLIDMHTNIVKSIISRGKCEPIYYYFDMTSGAGIYQDNKRRWIIGSPVRAIKHLEYKGIKYEAFLFERSLQSYEHLKIYLSIYFGSIHLLNVDHQQITGVRVLPGKLRHYGLVYSDTNGSIPPFEIFKELSYREDFKYIDFLTTYAAASHKRQIKSPDCEAYLRLPDYLEKGIQKKFWLIREPVGRHQWTFLVGTNWADFPKWNKQGFYGITTERGQEIYRRISMTKDELF